MPLGLRNSLITSSTKLSGGGVAPSNDLLDMLVSSWEFEESSGNPADSHGSNTLSKVDSGNITQGVTGKVGNAIDFLGPAAHVELANASAGDLQIGTGSWAVEFAVSIDSIPASGFRGLIKFGGNNNTDEGINVALYANDSTIRVNISNGTTRTILDGNASVLSSGTFAHVIAQVDRVGNRIKIYVDNVEVGDKSISGFSSDDIQSSADFEINGEFTGNGIVGIYDNVRVYNDLLTASMRTFLWNSGNLRSYADLSNFS